MNPICVTLIPKATQEKPNKTYKLTLFMVSQNDLYMYIFEVCFIEDFENFPRL